MHWTTRGSSPLRAVPYAQVAGGFASFLRMAEVLGMTKTMDRRAATHKKVLYSGADTSAGLLHWCRCETAPCLENSPGP